MNQHDRIRQYLDDFGSITPMQAFFDLGITKLSTRIGEMIRSGDKITKTMVTKENRYGEKRHFMMYEKAV
jgi:hypothetical protein